MHRISYIEIKNFRACKDVSIPLESFTPLVGQNNTGKSTILEALQWVLKPKALSKSDFSVEGEPVVVTLCIEGIDAALLEQIPVEKHRTAIEPYCPYGKLWIRCKATGATKATTKAEVYEVEQHTDDGVPEHWRDYPTGLPQAVSVLLPDPLYIEAMDDIGEDLGKAKAGTTIKELLDEIMNPILSAHNELNTALDTIRGILAVDGENRSGHLEAFDQAASESLKEFFPGIKLELDLQTLEIKEFFKAGDLHVTDSVTGDRRKFDQMGTGVQRAIQMALIRHLADARSATTDNPARRLLLIDEPELYLHPQAVIRLRQALFALSALGFQVVFSTHSPLMLSRDNTADTVIVSKQSDLGTVTQQPLRHAITQALDGAPAQSRTLFELSNLAEVYFSQKVIICEGKTDRQVLPVAYERLYGQPMDLDGISIISLGSCGDIIKAQMVLQAMRVNVFAIADLDFAYTHARKGAGAKLPVDDENMVAVKVIFETLQPEHDFTLNGNGLPQSKGEWAAADVFALMANTEQGQQRAVEVRDTLKDKGIWVWPQGCIEHITGVLDKGEEAIIEQEQLLNSMSQQDIEHGMPEFKACFDWIRA